MMSDYFMSGKFYVNGDNGDNGGKVLTGYFSATATSHMNVSEVFDQLFDAVVEEHKVHPKMVCVEQFNKV